MGVEWARDVLQCSFKIIQQYLGRKITLFSVCFQITGKSLGWCRVEPGAISSLFLLLLINSIHGSISTIYYSLILTTTTTRRPGVLRFMGLQRVGHNWATELNWTTRQTEVLFSKNSQVLSSNLYIILAPHLSSLMSALLLTKMFEMVSIGFLCDRISTWFS